MVLPFPNAISLTWRTVNVHVKYVLLDLEEKKMLGNFLNKLLAHILGVKFGQILKE
jgi:hypothetical protein